jgi:5'-deoxynucleotidase YfbR-like HD superfamily hydrolase
MGRKEEAEVSTIREKTMRSRYIAGTVVRYHTWPTLRKPTVAEHCWRVACIYTELFGLPRAEVLYYCLHHDSGELSAGDVPFPVKNNVPGLREAMEVSEEQGLQKLGITLPSLTEDETRRVKISDLLEMHEFGAHEVAMGNTFAMPVLEDTFRAAAKIATNEEQKLIFNWRYGS